MNNAIINFPLPANEPVKTYLESSSERIALKEELERQYNTVVEIPAIIGGKEIFTGKTAEVRNPCEHGHVLARYHMVGEKEVKMAIEAALEARKAWIRTPWTTRAAINLKCAELLSTTWRAKINAATMLGQGKNIYQAEIDAAAEACDFFRYNVSFASQIYGMQPKDAKNCVNHNEFRPLEGFVLAITPFNFTSIASNLCMAPVLMGNVAIWKPSRTALLSNYYLMKLYKEAGLPDGVINFLPGSGELIADICTESRYFAGLHFTGSTDTFNKLWAAAAKNVEKYISYPRIVGETGGKDFIFVHPSADAAAVAHAAFTGAFEYQGQKCSAASRMYIPKSLWPEVLERMKKMAGEVKMGPASDLQNYINAVIDEASFNRIEAQIANAKSSPEAKIVLGGKCDKSVGWFVEPTIIETTNPKFKSMVEEIFGPVLTVCPYEDAKWEEVVKLCDETSPYGLTGSVFGKDRIACEKISEMLRYAAGNFYINDRPTGAVVGCQPFGGARASGTDDKAGGPFNLFRWICPRTIKETLVSPTDPFSAYPFIKR
jgi:1-pyrroline-5-carboxylate dehydrogenase